MIVKNTQSAANTQPTSVHSTLTAKPQQQPYAASSTHYQHKGNSQEIPHNDYRSASHSSDYQHIPLTHSMITNNTYAMLHNTTVNVNANIHPASSTHGAATLLLTNLLSNMSEKENLSKTSGGSGVNNVSAAAHNETTSEAALYNFLKSKHLSKEIQQRLNKDSSSKDFS